MPLRALLFDLDGTLIDSDARHFEAFRRVSVPYGIVFDEAFFLRHMSGHTNAEACAALYPSLSAAEHLRIADEKEALFRTMLTEGASAIRGARELIDWAAARDIRLGVVSNAPPDNISASLKAIGLEGRFDVEIGGGMVARGKPDPAPYLEALVRLGVAARQAAAFEDSPLGVRAAVAASVATVGLTTTQSPKVLAEAGAALEIGDFSDPRLKDFLTDLWRAKASEQSGAALL
jgi:HAD superfamily hydrolase (TIGR01509 family)